MLTTREKMIKNGWVGRLSGERFNRYKGAEWYFFPKIVDGQSVILGWYGGYPDACPSEFDGEAIMIEQEPFFAIYSDERPINELWRHLCSVGTAMSMEQYKAVVEQATAVPVCEHCHQTIL